MKKIPETVGQKPIWYHFPSFSPGPAYSGCRAKKKRWLLFRESLNEGKYSGRAKRERVREAVCTGSDREGRQAFTQWFRYDWIMNAFWLTTSSPSVIYLLFSAGALCTWTTRYQLARLAHTGSLQSPWRNSVLLLTLLQESTQHASHMNNQILSLHSNTLEPGASLPHFIF